MSNENAKRSLPPQAEWATAGEPSSSSASRPSAAKRTRSVATPTLTPTPTPTPTLEMDGRETELQLGISTGLWDQPISAPPTATSFHYPYPFFTDSSPVTSTSTSTSTPTWSTREGRSQLPVRPATVTPGITRSTSANARFLTTANPGEPVDSTGRQGQGHGSAAMRGPGLSPSSSSSSLTTAIPSYYTPPRMSETDYTHPGPGPSSVYPRPHVPPVATALTPSFAHMPLPLSSPFPPAGFLRSTAGPPTAQSQSQYSHRPLPIMALPQPPEEYGPDPASLLPLQASASVSRAPSPSAFMPANSPIPPSQGLAMTLSSSSSPRPAPDEVEKPKPREGEKNKGKSRGVPGPKARIPAEAKVAIAEHIIAKGVAMANVDELAQMTGLTKQQIKSQLVDNRQNVRKQLSEFARSLQ